MAATLGFQLPPSRPACPRPGQLGTDRGASRDSVQSSMQMGEIRQHLHDATQELNRELDKRYARMLAWLWEEEPQNKVLRQAIRRFEEAVEQEEGCQQQRRKEAEAPGSMLPEVVAAQLERAMLSRRRGFIYWLQTLCLLLVGLQLAVGFVLAAAVLYASWYDPELFYRLLLRMLPEEAYTRLAYTLGEILPVVSEGPLPF